MSVCTFLAADTPLPAVQPKQDYPIVINIDDGIIFDGGADDNFFLHPFPDVQTYTDRSYGVWLDWQYTPGRARQIIEYIRHALQYSASIDFWHIWLLGYWEYEERPVIHRRRIALADLTVDDIHTLDTSPIWNAPDKHYPDRPSFYCITVTRS